VIDSEEQRKVTIATSLAIPCPGIWGVVALLSGIFFEGAAPLIAGALFVASILHIMFTAWFFRDKSVRKEEMPGLIMELPPFHMPNWKTIFQYVWGKAKTVTVKAGGAIGIGILGVWALTYTDSGDITQSALYGVGKFLEPATQLVGFDWRLALSFIIAAFSKEATLGAIAIFFGLSEYGTSLGSAIYSPIAYDATALSAAIGATVSKASALAFIFAFYFNIPCFGTIAAIRSETHSAGLTLKLSAYYVVTALIIAGIVYRIGLMIF
jgi:ferrous iron transport protein B